MEKPPVAVQLDTIIQGDCVAKLKELQPGSVDLVFADPPFNIGYDYDVYDDSRGRQDYLDWSTEWMSAVAGALKPSGTFWLAIGDEFAAELKVRATEAIGLSCRSWVIWYYTFGVNCTRGFSRSHTHLFHFVKDADDFTFNADNPAIRVPSARQLVYGDLRANPKGRLPDNTWILRPQDAPGGAFDTMHDTWYFARVAGTFNERETFHGCQMPEQLLGRIIRTSSNPGDLVVDPFAGSGTTLAVAKKLGRRWLGIELSKDYVKRIGKRIDGARVGGPLDGPEDPIRSAPTTSNGRSNVRMRNGRPVPKADTQTEKGIIAAYRNSASGHSTDSLLCDRERNAAFVDSCKKKGIAGNAYNWNRLLLRIRKAGRLPKVSRHTQRLTFEQMDSYSFAAEIAMQLIGLDYAMTIDDVLCDPKIAARFDALAEGFAPGHTSFEYRWAALSIRKRAVKAKALAKKQFGDWQRRPLPRPVRLARCDAERFDCPGVYVLLGNRQKLYVGETYNLRNRIQDMQRAERWATLDADSLRFIASNDPALQHGLQSALIGRTEPLFNSSLLWPKVA